MARKISSLNELVAILGQAEGDLTKGMKQAVAKGAVKVQSDAKKKFGTYQPAVGPYPAWANLKESTIKQKERAGGGDDPLIGHYPGKNSRGGGGKLRNSILVQNHGLYSEVGTNDPIAKHHEFGAPRKKIPPRPFLRPALYQNQDFIKKQFQEAIVTV
jgi:phage gpG-like protein